MDFTYSKTSHLGKHQRPQEQGRAEWPRRLIPGNIIQPSIPAPTAQGCPCIQAKSAQAAAPYPEVRGRDERSSAGPLSRGHVRRSGHFVRPRSYPISFKDKAVQSLQGHDSCRGAECGQSGEAFHAKTKRQSKRNDMSLFGRGHYC